MVAIEDYTFDKILEADTLLEALEALETTQSLIGSFKYCPCCKIWGEKKHATDCKLKDKINKLKLDKLKRQGDHV